MSDTKKKAAALSEEDLSEVAGGAVFPALNTAPGLNAEAAVNPDGEKQVTTGANVLGDTNRVVSQQEKVIVRNKPKRGIPRG